MRRLIVNADDFGLTSGVNRAILEAHQQGIVTSATLMARGRTFAEAVRMAQSAPQLSVGCHVVLLDGSPMLPGVQVPSLLGEWDDHGARFRDGFAGFAWRSLRGRISEDEVEAEATAQIQKLQAAGIAVSHLDTHKHTHMFPQALRPLLRAAKACGIRAVRNPLEPIRLGQVAKHPGLWKRWSQVKILNRMAREFRAAVQEAGMLTPDGTLGIVATGTMGDRFLKLIFDHMPEGTWELVCHPGYNDLELRSMKTRLRESRVRELQLLISEETRQQITERGIELISYRALNSSAN